MSKEIGPREKALREQREENFGANQKHMLGIERALREALPALQNLKAAVDAASKKRGKPRKVKK